MVELYDFGLTLFVFNPCKLKHVSNRDGERQRVWIPAITKTLNLTFLMHINGLH